MTNDTRKEHSPLEVALIPDWIIISRPGSRDSTRPQEINFVMYDVRSLDFGLGDFDADKLNQLYRKGQKISGMPKLQGDYVTFSVDYDPSPPQKD